MQTQREEATMVANRNLHNKNKKLIGQQKEQTYNHKKQEMKTYGAH